MLLCLWMRGLWGRYLLGESPWVLHNRSSKAKPEVMDPFISLEVETRKFPRTWMYEYTLLSLEWSGYNAGKLRIDDNHPQATIFSLALVFFLIGFGWSWRCVQWFRLDLLLFTSYSNYGILFLYDLCAYLFLNIISFF